MEPLQIAANNLKISFAERIKDRLNENNYGLKSCFGNSIKTFNNIKLELIFINNLCYIPLTAKQLYKVKSENYKDLFSNSLNPSSLENIELTELSDEDKCNY